MDLLPDEIVSDSSKTNNRNHEVVLRGANLPVFRVQNWANLHISLGYPSTHGTCLNF